MNEQPLIPSLTISESLQKSWKTVIDNVWLFAGFTILYFIVFGIIGRIPLVSSVANLFSFIFTVSLFSGFYAAEKNGTVEFNDFFSWTPKFAKLFVASLILMVLAIIVFLPLIIVLLSTVGLEIFKTIYSNGTGSFFMNSSSFSGGLLMLMALLAFAFGFLFLLLTFAYFYLVLFKDMAPMDALKLSWQIGKKNIGSIIAFIFISIGVALLGVLALGIGLLVAIPVIIGMQYFFLRSIFPDDLSENWDIMKQQDPTPQP